MNKTLFYKIIGTHITRKILNKLPNNKHNIMILYDFFDNYYDVSESTSNKVRLGIKDFTHDRLKYLHSRMRSLETFWKSKFDIIDMRHTMRYEINDGNDVNMLFEFMENHLSDNGYIIGFINVSNEMNEKLSQSDTINKGDELWIPDDTLSEEFIKRISVESLQHDYRETQYYLDTNELNNIIKGYGLEINFLLSLSEFKWSKELDNVDLVGEKFIIINRIEKVL